jgi:hypothetical protein
VFDAYARDEEFKTVDAVVCFLPLSMCELYLALNKSVFMIAAVRYEHGQGESRQWARFNRVIQRVAANPRNLVAANSVYDAEYLRYFTGVNATYVPSLCDDVRARYTGTNPVVLLAHSHVEGSGLAWNVAVRALANRTITFAGINNVYPRRYEYADLATHRAMVHFPYTVSVMSFFEHYRMNIPLFVPSLEFMIRLQLKHGLLSERTWERTITGRVPANSSVPRHPSYPAAPDPNDDTSAEALRYWLRFADFYVLPHVQYFDSFDDLVVQIEACDLMGVSLKMQEENKRRINRTVEQWREILKRVVVSPVTPATYEEGMREYT